MFKILLILFVFINFNALAHQPKLINYSPSTNNPHLVIDNNVCLVSYEDPGVCSPQTWLLASDD